MLNAKINKNRSKNVEISASSSSLVNTQVMVPKVDKGKEEQKIVEQNERKENFTNKRRKFLLTPRDENLLKEVNNMDLVDFLNAKTYEDTWNARLKIAVTAHIYFLSTFSAKDLRLAENLR
jgi:hypothetical protein